MDLDPTKFGPRPRAAMDTTPPTVSGSPPPPPTPPRDKWHTQCDFILCCIGKTVGLGNIWRFTYMSLRYGGITFLVPYLILLVVMGVPLYVLELTPGAVQRRRAQAGVLQDRPGLLRAGDGDVDGAAMLRVRVQPDRGVDVVLRWSFDN